MTEVHHVCNLDKQLYSVVTKDIASDEVIITTERIGHIAGHHPGDYEKYRQYIEQAITKPDYIIEANRPNTALILKEIKLADKVFKLILRLKTSKEPVAYKNSVITFMKIDAKEWNRLVKNKKNLYKSPARV